MLYGLDTAIGLFFGSQELDIADRMQHTIFIHYFNQLWNAFSAACKPAFTRNLPLDAVQDAVFSYFGYIAQLKCHMPAFLIRLSFLFIGISGFINI